MSCQVLRVFVLPASVFLLFFFTQDHNVSYSEGAKLLGEVINFYSS